PLRQRIVRRPGAREVRRPEDRFRRPLPPRAGSQGEGLGDSVPPRGDQPVPLEPVLEESEPGRVAGGTRARPLVLGRRPLEGARARPRAAARAPRPGRTARLSRAERAAENARAPRCLRRARASRISPAAPEPPLGIGANAPCKSRLATTRPRSTRSTRSK